MSLPDAAHLSRPASPRTRLLVTSTCTPTR